MTDNPRNSEIDNNPNAQRQPVSEDKSGWPKLPPPPKSAAVELLKNERDKNAKDES